MALGFLWLLALDLVDLLRMSLVVAVPAFLLVLVGKKVNQYIRDKYNYSWIVAAALSVAVVLTPIVFALYLIPYALGYLESPLVGQVAPEFMQLTLVDYAMALVSTVFKNVLSIVLFTVLLMPLLFIGSFIGEKVEERKKLSPMVHDFVTVFLTAVVAWVIVFVLDYVGIGLIPAVFWKLYWSPI